VVDEGSHQYRRQNQVGKLNIGIEWFAEQGWTGYVLNATRSASEIRQHITLEQDADDLAKTKGNDRQIITPQAHQRQPQQQPSQRGKEDPQHNSRPEADHQIMRYRGVEQRHGISANGKEGDVA